MSIPLARSTFFERSGLQWPTLLTVKLGALISFLIGLTGIVGWFSQIPRLLQVWPGMPRMTLDSSAAFVLIGIGILCAAAERKQSGMVLSATVLLIGFANLIDRSRTPSACLHLFYPTASALLLDKLPIASVQMAISTIAVFIAVGVCLTLLSRHDLGVAFFWMGSLAATFIASVGGLGLLALIAGFNAGSGWNSFLSRMSFPSAIASITIGLTLLQLFWIASRKENRQVAVVSVVLTLTGMLILFAGVDSAVVISTTAALQTKTSVSQTNRDIQTLEALLEAVRSAETGQRGYLLTGDASFLGSYRYGSQSTRLLLQQLTTPPFEARKALSLITVTRLKLDELRTTVELESLGHHHEALQIVLSQKGLVLMTQIDTQAHSLKHDLQVELEFQNELNAKSIALVKSTTSLSYLSAVLLAGIAIFLVTRELRRSSRYQTALLEHEAVLEERIAHRTLSLELEIDGRVQVEDLLRRSEDRLSSALNFAGVVAWSWSPEQDAIVWHGPVSDVFGVDGEALSHYSDLRSLAHPDDRPLLDEATRIGVDYDAEFRIIRSGGEIRWIAGRGGAVLNDSVVAQMYGINFDITDRKLAAQALEQSELKLRTRERELSMIFNAGTIGTFSWNLLTDTVTCHPTMWRLYGSLPKASVGISWFRKRHHPDDANAISKAMRESLRSGRELDIEYRVVQPDQSIGWLSCRGATLSDNEGKVYQVNGLAIDVTARKTAELELKQRESEFKSLANAMPQIVWIARRDGFVEYYNDRWYELTGYAPGPGGDASWAPLLHPDDLQPSIDRWYASVRSGEPFEMELRFWDRKLKAHRWYLSRSMPVPDKQGTIVKWFGTCTDIHQQKAAKEILEAEVQSRTEDLRRTVAEKPTLLRELHHRVKNNLQVIASLLKMQSTGLRDPAAIAALEESRQRVYSMALIHERLYSNQQVSHIDLGPYTRTLVEELIRSYAQAAKVTPVIQASTILLDIDQAIPCGLIINELVTNALKYAYRNEATGNLTVSLTENQEGWVCLKISDQGPGLPAGLDWKNSKSIGLSIVDILAKQLGGRWSVTNAGPGACVSVEFPKEKLEQGLAA